MSKEYILLISPYNLWFCHTPIKTQKEEYMNIYIYMNIIYIVKPFNHLQMIMGK